VAEGDAFSILLLTRYSQNGASSRLRCYNYLSILERTGFHVTNAAFFGGDYVDKLYRGKFYGVGHLLRDYAKRVRRLLFAQSYDLIWIEKEVLPYLPACFERIFFGDKPYVVDYDDLWHLRYTEQRNPLVRGILSRKLETIAQRAAAVVVGNPVLADWAHRAGAQRVIEIPTVVDLKRYQSKPLPDGRFTIGWIGTPITEKYLEIAAEPLRYMQERFGAKVRLIGVSENFSIPGVEIERVEWREDTEADELSRCHVGIMPLTDGPWERGKCGYKLVQYMASARATVASPVGFNKTVTVDKKTGFFAGSTAEWTKVLSWLATNRDLSRTLGLAGRRRVEENYSLNVMAPKLVEVLCDVAWTTSRQAGHQLTAAKAKAYNGRTGEFAGKLALVAQSRALGQGASD